MKVGQKVLCNFCHKNDFYVNELVEIIEFKKMSRANPQALVKSLKFGMTFYKLAKRLVEPVVFKSSCRVWWDGFNITILSYWYKTPSETYCTVSTPFVIENITANGFDLDNFEELSEFMVKPLELVKKHMIAEMFCYVDELPF